MYVCINDCQLNGLYGMYMAVALAIDVHTYVHMMPG